MREPPAVELAAGFFDGVHLGHRRLLDAMLSRARETGAKSVVFTFTNHPATICTPDRVPSLLMSCAARLACLKSMGVQEIFAVDFTRALADESPDLFADWLRATFPGLDTLFCGPNWTFGAGGTGDADFLRARGFRIEAVPFATWDNAPVSSTRIRAALAAGDLSSAAALLGRPYAVTGTLFHGKGLGRSLGFPTLNLAFSAEDCFSFLPFGVYAVNTPYGPGLANWGLAPTMGARAWQDPVLEVHLLSAPPLPLPEPPESMTVSFLRFLRPERKFDNTDALREQISRDLASIHDLL